MVLKQKFYLIPEKLIGLISLQTYVYQLFPFSENWIFPKTSLSLQFSGLPLKLNHPLSLVLQDMPF